MSRRLGSSLVLRNTKPVTAGPEYLADLDAFPGRPLWTADLAFVRRWTQAAAVLRFCRRNISKIPELAHVKRQWVPTDAIAEARKKAGLDSARHGLPLGKARPARSARKSARHPNKAGKRARPAKAARRTVAHRTRKAATPRPR